MALFFATGLLAAGPLMSEIKIGVIAAVAGAFIAFGAARALKVGTFAR